MERDGWLPLPPSQAPACSRSDRSIRLLPSGGQEGVAPGSPGSTQHKDGWAWRAPRCPPEFRQKKFGPATGRSRTGPPVRAHGYRPLPSGFEAKSTSSCSCRAYVASRGSARAPHSIDLITEIYSPCKRLEAPILGLFVLWETAPHRREARGWKHPKKRRAEGAPLGPDDFSVLRRSSPPRQNTNKTRTKSQNRARRSSRTCVVATKVGGQGKKSRAREPSI